MHIKEHHYHHNQFIRLTPGRYGEKQYQSIWIGTEDEQKRILKQNGVIFVKKIELISSIFYGEGISQ